MTTDTQTRPPLTARQAEVLQYIAQNSHMCAPTVREIGVGVGIKSPNGVVRHLRALERKGFLRRNPGKSRNIEIIEVQT